MNPLSDFTVSKTLNDDPFHHVKVVAGRIGNDDAVVLVKRRHVDDDTIASLSKDNTDTNCKLVFDNDIYKQYLYSSPLALPDLLVDVICPATEKHVQKYADQAKFMVAETPALYAEVVQPYIASIPASRIEWVHNLLEKKKEAERMIFDDPDPLTGFMLHPDMKWDGEDPEQIYCVGICHRRDVRCLRDLDSSHLPLLKNMRDKAQQAIQERFGVKGSKLRMFVHYPPSYFHFHIHYVNLKYQAAGVLAGKAVLLDDIIESIEAVGGDYYQKRTLHYTIGEEEELGRLISARLQN